MSLIGQLKKRTWELKHSYQTLMKMMMASVSDCCGVHPPTYPPHPHPLTPSSSLTHSHPPHPHPPTTLLIPHPLTHAFTQPLTLIPLTYFHLPPPPHPPQPPPLTQMSSPRLPPPPQMKKISEMEHLSHRT